MVSPGDLVLFRPTKGQAPPAPNPVAGWRLYKEPTTLSKAVGHIKRNTMCVVISLQTHGHPDRPRSNPWVLLLTDKLLGWRWEDEVREL